MRWPQVLGSSVAQGTRQREIVSGILGEVGEAEMAMKWVPEEATHIPVAAARVFRIAHKIYPDHRLYFHNSGRMK